MKSKKMTREEVISEIINNLLTECKDTDLADMLEEYFYFGFEGFKNYSNESLLKVYENPFYEDQPRVKISGIKKDVKIL